MKRNTFILTAITLFIGILTSCSPKEKAVTLANWMQQIEGQTPICKISIPATHDSGALLGGAALQCQDITIREQLENGIRGFDILYKQSQTRSWVYIIVYNTRISLGRTMCYPISFLS